jgi:Tol biopolymer transport system component
MYMVAAHNQNLFYIAVDGDRKPITFAQTLFSECCGKFSPDGKWVAYHSDEPGRGTRELWVTLFPGPGPRMRISEDGAGLARWGRDGTELFFLNSGNRLRAANSGSSTLNVGSTR